MALPVRREDGRWFVRGLWGYPTEAAARAAAKELWWRGSAVRVEARGGRCDVCGAGKAVYRSREAQVKVCEGVMRGWCGSGIRGRGVR